MKSANFFKTHLFSKYVRTEILVPSCPMPNTQAQAFSFQALGLSEDYDLCFVPPPPKLSGCIIFAPARAIFLHNDLHSVMIYIVYILGGGGGGTNGKDPSNAIAYS